MVQKTKVNVEFKLGMTMRRVWHFQSPIIFIIFIPDGYEKFIPSSYPQGYRYMDNPRRHTYIILKEKKPMHDIFFIILYYYWYYILIICQVIFDVIKKYFSCTKKKFWFFFQNINISRFSQTLLFDCLYPLSK